MSGITLRAGIFGLLIFCLCGAPLLPASAAVALDTTENQSAAVQADGWHPLSFVYSLLQPYLDDGDGLESAARESGIASPSDAASVETSNSENTGSTCLGPGIEPNGSC